MCFHMGGDRSLRCSISAVGKLELAYRAAVLNDRCRDELSFRTRSVNDSNQPEPAAPEAGSAVVAVTKLGPAHSRSLPHSGHSPSECG
jgi:hypothetical protein